MSAYQCTRLNGCFQADPVKQYTVKVQGAQLANKISNTTKHFTFMLPCIVIDFFLNNQPDALIIPILFCYKTLHVSDIFSAYHQESQQSQDGTAFHPDSA
jgi:hypothetical protein